MSHKDRKIGRRPDTTAASPPQRVVLIADDDPDWRLLVRDALAGELPTGVDVREAEDGHLALQFLMREGPHSDAPPVDLLYLDCEMPRVDGFTLLKLMRQSPRLRKVPVIMLTGVCDEASMRRAFELGATGWIVKPASLPDLKRSLIASARHSLELNPTPKRAAHPSPKWAA